MAIRTLGAGGLIAVLGMWFATGKPVPWQPDRPQPIDPVVVHEFRTYHQAIGRTIDRQTEILEQIQDLQRIEAVKIDQLARLIERIDDDIDRRRP